MQIIITAATAVAATFIGIELVKSFIDSFIVSQPFIIRFGKNMTSFIADACWRRVKKTIQGRVKKANN